MSYSVDIKPKRRIQPEEIFDKFIKRGECIIVTSDEFPYLKLGTINKALRGIEINKDDDCLEVRICSCASEADYRLFIVAIDILMEATGGKARSEEGEEVTNPYKTFDEQWIEKQTESSWSIIKTLAKNSGSAIIMQGLFLPFCIGPHLLRSEGINLYGSYDSNKPKYEKLSVFLVLTQWRLKDCIGTQSRMALRNPEKPDEDSLEISLITIKDNKVNNFDYISYAPLLGFIDLDSDESVLIHIENLTKILDEYNHLARFDEFQHCCCGGKPTVNEIKKLMALAQRYTTENLHCRPSYPGSGYDDKQNTFILMWNPSTSDTDRNTHIHNISNIFNEDIHQQIHDWKDAKMGDRFFVVKVQDNDINGIVMSGVFGSQPYVPSNWSGKGRKSYHVDLKPNMILNPYTIPMLTTTELEDAIPDFMWRGGYSGRLLTEEQARTLENLFASYLEKISEKDDGVNLCITRKM